MALSDTTSTDLIEVVGPYSLLQVRTTRMIKDGDQIIGESHSRHVVAPGDDLSGEDPKVQAIAASVHTPAVIAAYQEYQRSLVPPEPTPQVEPNAVSTAKT
jgi:hypothetical protein